MKYFEQDSGSAPSSDLGDMSLSSSDEVFVAVYDTETGGLDGTNWRGHDRDSVPIVPEQLTQADVEWKNRPSAGKYTVYPLKDAERPVHASGP